MQFPARRMCLSVDRQEARFPKGLALRVECRIEDSRQLRVGSPDRIWGIARRESLVPGPSSPSVWIRCVGCEPTSEISSRTGGSPKSISAGRWSSQSGIDSGPQGTVSRAGGSVAAITASPAADGLHGRGPVGPQRPGHPVDFKLRRDGGRWLRLSQPLWPCLPGPGSGVLPPSTPRRRRPPHDRRPLPRQGVGA